MLEDDLNEEQQEHIEDRGDQVDPGLIDDIEQDDQQEQEQDDQDEEIDLDALRDLAGEERRPSMVPHARFNEVNESLKAEREARLRLEEELARERGSARPAVTEDPLLPSAFDFTEADRRYNDALYEGDTDKAAQVRAEIRAAERAEFERLAEEKAEARYAARMAQQEQEQTRSELERTAATLVAKYSFLDSDSADADPDAIGEVVALRDAYIGRGTPPGEALAKAAERVARLNGYRVDDEKPARQSVTQEQIQRNLEREQRIPPRDRGVGERAARIDYASLSEAEFEKMSEAEKAKARGDFIG